MQINKISLSRLRKSEILLMMDNIIGVLKKHDVEKLHLGFMLKVLEKNHPKLRTIGNLPGPLKLTPEVQKWHNDRVNYACSISTQMKGIAQANLEIIREEIEIANDFVQPYFIGLRNKSGADIDGLIDQFLRKVKNDPKIDHAFTKIGLMPYIDQLAIAHGNYNRLYIERLGESAEIQKGHVNKAIMKEVQAAFRTLFEQVEVGNRTYPELDYEPLMRQLNGVIVRYSNKINTRATYSKKRAEKARAEKEAAANTKSTTELKAVSEDRKEEGEKEEKKPEKKDLGNDVKKDDENNQSKPK